MHLKKCDVCKEDMSANAPICLKCGATYFSGILSLILKWSVAIILIWFTISLFVGFFFGVFAAMVGATL